MRHTQWLAALVLLPICVAPAQAVEDDGTGALLNEWEYGEYGEYDSGDVDESEAAYNTAGDVDAALERIAEAVYGAYAYGELTDNGAAVLYDVLESVMADIQDTRQYWGMGGALSGTGETEGDVYFSRITPDRQLYLSSGQAAEYGEEPNDSKQIELYIDENGLTWMGMATEGGYDGQMLSLDENWQEEYDALMLQIEDMVEGFMEEHGTPIEDEPL